MILKKYLFILAILSLATSANSDTSEVIDNTHAYSFYSGTFDKIDKEGDDKSSLIGLEHKDENLFRNTILGKFSPVTGGFVTGNNSVYLYTGIEAEYSVSRLKIKPGFAPGYYDAGDGKDLGNMLQFKSEVNVFFKISKSSEVGFGSHHISNAGLSSVNPGTNNYYLIFKRGF